MLLSMIHSLPLGERIPKVVYVSHGGGTPRPPLLVGKKEIL